MLILQATWCDARLHLWSEPENGDTQTEGRDRSQAKGATDDVVNGETAQRLRSAIGEVFDSLLVSGASRGELQLLLPHANGSVVGSMVEDTNGVALGAALGLVSCRVPTLTFSPADAIDLLSSRVHSTGGHLLPGVSFVYWQGAAGLVLELLAKQQFVPAIHRVRHDVFRGYWRPVIDDESTLGRITRLIHAMPPVCRCFSPTSQSIQARALIENFLWTTVDSLVRRCLDGDELAHALQEETGDDVAGQVLWLRSLVSDDADVGGSQEQGEEVYRTVQSWLGGLNPFPPGRTCRVCFRLTAPSRAAGSMRDDDRAWRLTLHLQALDDPKLVIDARALMSTDERVDPKLLRTPFDNALEQLREDVELAARRFPPLEPCSEPNGPTSCDLSVQQAYTFLRDVVPLIESEGLGVWLPEWWNEDRPRLRMWLDLHPHEGGVVDAGTRLGLDTMVSYDWRIAVGDERLTQEEMSKLAASNEPLVQVRGVWTEIQPAELQTAKRFLERNSSGTMTVQEALHQCFIADDLSTGLSVGGLQGRGWINALLHADDSFENVDTIQPPSSFRGELRPYQLRGMAWLHFLSRLGLGALLADDMGLGKTIQLIALLLLEREQVVDTGPTLLVVPMSLVGNWHREIDRFAPDLKVMVHHGTERLSGARFVDEVTRFDVVISTYGLIHRDFEHLAEVNWHRVALDEAQNIKNPAAKQTLAVRGLRAGHRVALTGTPVENRLSELWSIMNFLNEQYLGGANEFRRRFAVPIERHHDTERAIRLRHLVRPFLLRRLKNDPKVEVDLPEKMEMKVYCNLTAEQAALYQSVVDEMMGQIDVAGGIQRRGLILATLVKLKQICNHPAHFSQDDSSLAHRSGKCDRLVEMIEVVLAEGDSALIFTQFRQMGVILERLLRESFEREVMFFHGGTSRKNRDRMVERFQKGHHEAPLLLLSLRAGGYGLNLTAASHVFHFDRWWNPAVEDQATDRAHRIGQDKRVQVHKFVCIGTLEEKIDTLLDQKRNLADNVLGSGEEWLTEFSTEKLREVLRLSREAVAEN